MTRSSRRRAWSPAGPILALLAAAAAAGLQPAPAAAAGTEFGTPTATATWGKGVAFTEPAVLPTTPIRVEAVVETAGSDSSFLSELPSSGQRPGPTVFAYTLDASTAGILPNTRFTARWRVTYPDGTVEVGPPVSVTYSDTRFQWRTVSGPVVRVHWYEGSDAFGRQALRIAEDGIAKASGVLGVTDDTPVDFYVYADQPALLGALGPGTREWVGGTLDPDTRTLFATIAPAEIGTSSVAAEIPHELTHLVFDTAVRNPFHQPPRWFDEGLAVYLSQGYDAGDRGLVGAAVGDGGLMPLTALGGEFPTTSDRAALAYAESVAAMDFLVRTYGQAALHRMVTAYAAGSSDDEAFRAALGTDVAGFQEAWLKDLGAAPPKRYGPQSPPPGPLPAGWSEDSTGGVAVGGGAPPSTPGAAAGPVGESGSGLSPVWVVVPAGALILVLLYAVSRRRGRRETRPPMPDATDATVPGPVPATPPEARPAATGTGPMTLPDAVPGSPDTVPGSPDEVPGSAIDASALASGEPPDPAGAR